MEFQKLIDLASERLGGAACYATDDFFAPKENMLRPGRGEFIPGKYTDNGKWMDGWESRRRRNSEHDWCIIRLGLPGRVRGFDVDTNHFLGNAPKAISVEGFQAQGYVPVARLLDEKTNWERILGPSDVKPGSQNLFEVASEGVFTHLRLHIFPDGGVARFRAYGEVRPDWTRLLAEHRVIDLAAAENGGLAVAASDEFFSDKQNLIMPGRSVNMGDGWETKRRRAIGSTPIGNDWIIVKLGRPGKLSRAELDTSHFKGNFPDSASLEGTFAPNSGEDADKLESVTWSPLLRQTKLEAHTRHAFDLDDIGPCTHVRMNIFPDGGVARLRLFGEAT